MTEEEVAQQIQLVQNQLRDILYGYPITVKTIKQYFHEIIDDQFPEKTQVQEVSGVQSNQ